MYIFLIIYLKTILLIKDEESKSSLKLMDAINNKEVELVEEILKFFHDCHRRAKQTLNDLFLTLLKN